MKEVDGLKEDEDRVVRSRRLFEAAARELSQCYVTCTFPAQIHRSSGFI